MVDEKIKRVPEVPGVYLLKNKRDKVLYVGKAKNLRVRIRNHYSSNTSLHPRFNSLKKKIKDFDFMVARSESEALLLEANLIKKYTPKYNIRLKDDKKYPYLKVTIQDTYPRIYKTRDTRDDGSLLFGPFHSAKSLRKTIKTILKVFPIRTCKYKLPSKRKINPCLEYHLRRCPAPCVKNKVDPEEYSKNVKNLVKFFAGETEEVERTMIHEIAKLRKELSFEKAGILRDHLYALRDVHQTQSAVLSESISMDVIGVAKSGKIAVGVVLPVRSGKLQDKSPFILSVPENSDETEILEEFLIQYYARGIIAGKRILIPFSISGSKNLEEMLAKRRRVKVRVSSKPNSPREKHLLSIARQNALFVLHNELVDANFSGLPFSLIEIQNVLKLKKPPYVIEGLDASQTFGEERVGAVVVFENGKSKRSEYRKYLIKTPDKKGDPYLIYEITKRRFKRLLEENRRLPDIFLVDGGKPQLSFARKALEELNINGVFLCAFAKTFDQIYLKDGNMIYIPKRKSSALRLFKNVRKEMHRFAITYHRQRRGTKVRSSLLDDIERIGEKRKMELLRYFGSMEKLFSASPEDITKVDGFGVQLAKEVYEKLHKLG